MTMQNKREIENETRVALAAATAAELGEGWTFETTESRWGGTLVGPNSERIDCTGGWGSDGRLVLSATWPSLGSVNRDDSRGQITWGRAGHRDSGRLEITVGLTRTPKAVASEIRRRLLPDYVEELPGRLAEAERHLAQYLEAEAFRAEIAETVTPLGGMRNEPTGKLSTYDGTGKHPHTDWEISNSLRYLKVEISNLTPDQMRAVANLLATF